MMFISANKIALTIDVEDWYHTPAVTGSDFSTYPDVKTFMGAWKSRFDYLSDPTRLVLDILHEFQVQATFFIVADVADYYPGLIESIAEHNHEIGCHGLYHELSIHTRTKAPQVSVAEFEDRTGRARAVLQQVSGQAVEGYRAPGAYIGAWMLDSLMKLGFSYDSSVNPNSVFNKTDFDTRRISSEPYIIQDDRNNRLTELPWPYYQVGPLRCPTSGGPFLRFFPVSYLTAGLRQSLTRGDTLFYFHPLDIQQERLPLLTSINSRRPFYFMTSGKTTEKKLRAILQTFSACWTCCREIVQRNTHPVRPL